VFDLPGGANPITWTYGGGANGPSLSDFSLSLGGTAIGQITDTENFSARTQLLTRKLAEAPGWSTYLSDGLVLPLNTPPAVPSIALSPDGKLAAICDFPSFPPTPMATTNIFNGGRLIGTARGYPLAWLDDSRLLVQVYASPDAGVGGLPFDSPDGPLVYAGSTLCDAQGNVTASVALPILSHATPVGANRVYSSDTVTIYNLSDGSVAWTSPVSGLPNALAGGWLVAYTDHRVIVEAHP
jgi:hypothetical protein